MIPYIIGPIDVNGTLLCVDDTTRRTAAVLTGAAKELATNEWEIARELADANVGTLGTVWFAVGCGTTKVTLRFSGTLSMQPFAPRNLEFFLNGSTYQPFEDAHAEWVANAPFGGEVISEEVDIDLTERVCGNVLSAHAWIRPNSRDIDIWWNVEIVSITGP